MSRVYFTASMPHAKFGKAFPILSFETTDHTGGSYDVAGLHPSSIATLFGKGPEIKKGERFDLKLNLNAKRAAISLVVVTTKHLPHYEWSSDGGFGKLPLVALGTLATQLFKGGGPRSRDGKGAESRKSRQQSIFTPNSVIYTSDGGMRQKPPRKKGKHRESEKKRGDRPHHQKNSSSSSTRAHAGSTRPGRRHKKRPDKPPLDPSVHGPKLEHSGSRGAKVGGLRKRDRGYDSGYVSGSGIVAGKKPRSDSTDDKKTARRRRSRS